MYCHMKKIWCRCHSDETVANTLSHNVTKRTGLSGFLLRMILSSTLFLSISAAICMIGVFPVKGAYATSTSKSSSSLPLPASLHGTTINKHQVWNVHQYAHLHYTCQYNDQNSNYVILRNALLQNITFNYIYSTNFVVTLFHLLLCLLFSTRIYFACSFRQYFRHNIQTVFQTVT